MKSIKIKENNNLIVELHDYLDNPTGNYWEFDPEDVSNAIRYNESVIKLKEADNWLKMQVALINKKQDEETNGFMTTNQVEEQKAMNEYYKKGMEALNLFLGKNGCEKYLNGRNPYFTMFDDITEAIEQILPELKVSYDNVKEAIMNKYNTEESDVLE